MTRSVEACNRRMLRARDAMDRTFAEPLCIRRLARIAEVSEAHFIRTFRVTAHSRDLKEDMSHHARTRELLDHLDRNRSIFDCRRARGAGTSVRPASVGGRLVGRGNGR
jgi:AraC-like DNA-binding protein